MEIVNVVVSSLALIPYVVRFFLCLYRSIMMPFIEKHAECDIQKEPLVSLVVRISRKSTIMPLLQSIRRQNYKNIELLVVISHSDEGQAKQIKHYFLEAHNLQAHEIQCDIFIDTIAYSSTKHQGLLNPCTQMLLSVAKGEYICVLHEEVIISLEGITRSLCIMQKRKIQALSVIPLFTGAGARLISYTPMVCVAFSMRIAVPYTMAYNCGAFMLINAHAYYKCLSKQKKDMKSMEVHRALQTPLLRHTHIFSAHSTCTVFSVHGYIKWFTSAFSTSSIKRSIENNIENNSRKSVVYAFLYISLMLILPLLLLVSNIQFFICFLLLSFITHSICIPYRTARYYTATIKWFTSFIALGHMAIILLTRIIKPKAK